jgi:hypothetical protein
LNRNIASISVTCERSIGGAYASLEHVSNIQVVFIHEERSNAGDSVIFVPVKKKAMFITADVSKYATRVSDVHEASILAISVTPVVFAATTSNKSPSASSKCPQFVSAYVKSHTLGEELTCVPVPFENVGVTPSVNLRRIVYGGRTIGGSHPTPFPLKVHALFPNVNQ